MPTNKRKIINDPVYGFIDIPRDLIFDLIEHPYFQRLRRIKQLGLTHLVYPGALHTRFHHSIGAMHLMSEALNILKIKGHKIKKADREGALVAILLHDIGHGPFSHALEHSLVKNIPHETLSGLMMEQLNAEFDGELTTGLEIFNHQHPKKFLSQLVASQLDMDRLDYLTRDSFFTGVSEGVIGTQRIIKMLNVADGKLVADIKGIYSIEKFIIARRIMYWQVYLHKTVLAAEHMLIRILERARYLVKAGTDLFATPSLKLFLQNDFNIADLSDNSDLLAHFSRIDDFDILTSVKIWSQFDGDRVLSMLCGSLINRKLFRCEIQKEPFDYFYIENIRTKIGERLNLTEEEARYFLISDTTSNYTYHLGKDNITVLSKSGKLSDITQASDLLNIDVLTRVNTKHFICYPKIL
ncbi:MAG: HD domain-containing protein [Bacteroidales bacterium]|nr:HD domain-containing protein [Bacteroidales bacterium]